MISSKNGEIKIKGDEATLMSDFGMTAHALLDTFVKSDMTRDEAVEKLTFAFNLGLKDEKELRAEAKRRVMELLEDIINDSEEGEDNE